MSAYLYGAAFWLLASLVVGLLVARVIRRRDGQAPAGPRVRVEYRGARPWVQR